MQTSRMKPLRITSLSAPGRFPTVNLDPGDWWGRLSHDHDVALQRCCLNAAWWKLLCAPSIKSQLLSKFPYWQKIKTRLEWRANELNIIENSRLASRALISLKNQLSYRDRETYQDTINDLVTHFNLLNALQDGINISLESGPVASGVNYDSSSSLEDYARQDTLLASLINQAIDESNFDADVAFIRVTSIQDLLTALITARLLREKNAGIHISLIDHGYENFSLHAHADRLLESNSFSQFFDTIIRSKDERDQQVVELVAQLKNNVQLKGWLWGMQPKATETELPVEYVAPQETEIFSPVSVLWTRLSDRRCYWGKCAFCTQNEKYEELSPPSKSEIPATLDRIECLVKAGYKNFIFSDEAVSPSYLKQFCQGILDRKIRIAWTCRAKLEKVFNEELFTFMKEAGCCEVLFGLETISARMQKKMDKYVEGLDRQYISNIFSAAAAAGLSVHINLLAGFPGDTLKEVKDSVDFTIDALKDNPGSTYLLNNFVLFPDTPIYHYPERFGVENIHSHGDMPSAYQYCLPCEILRDSDAITNNIKALENKLDEVLGWNAFSKSLAESNAKKLYFSSGHGMLMKKMGEDNPFIMKQRTVQAYEVCSDVA